MNIDSIPGAVAISLGLTIGTQVLTVLVSAALGGFKFGSLARTIEVEVPEDEFQTFKERLNKRLEELGFVETGAGGMSARVFTQGVNDNMLVFTHAKTPKELTLETVDDSSGSMRTRLSLKYTDPIVADTGESAYRDAILNYLSGENDKMKIVPTSSQYGDYCFVGALLALFILVADFIFQWGFPSLALIVFCLTSFVFGLAALAGVIRRPHEISGLYRIVPGLIINGAVAGCLLISS